ncbi:insulinoma-associated protein 2 [Amblyraja radiata]|uniref:insulinoma-associated protein 2 n=1 Tax=Amblyraja radiata TaxID=386614 RepID=UPI00140295A8|nr:insulinoma-associated protein 2 [Amblyraja radiata]
MPRGFLVKRNIKSSPVSYRIRTEEMGPLAIAPVSGNVGATVHSLALPEPSSQRHRTDQFKDRFTRDKMLGAAHRIGALKEEHVPDSFYTTFPEYSISGWADVSYTPIKPIDKGLDNAFCDTCLSPSASGEPFGAATPLLLLQPALSPTTANCGGLAHLCSPFHGSKPRVSESRHRKHKSSPKKPKVTRRLNFEDEVCTSPVLGLRIKVDPRDCKPSFARVNKPLGEFICQLCKEQYSDSISLAQHKCSRIVRVEYRCLECDKMFSCPANLASHRRWHKPRTDPNPQWSSQKCSVESGSKENSGEPDCSAGTMDSTSSVDSARTMDSASSMDSAMDSAKEPGASVQRLDGHFQCRYCSKRFRRQAYLRKHVSAHEAAGPSVRCQMESSRIPFPCRLCGLDLQTAETRDKHLLWHAVSSGASAVLGPGCDEEHSDKGDLRALVFCCKHCPSTFFSSPGLTRHINKWHPSENRQVLLLQLPASTGC